MLRAMMSIIGLYNWNSEIFSGLHVPDGMDKELLIKDILMQAGELELLYPDWNVMQEAISVWTEKEYSIWVKMYNSTRFEYNPLWNVDGTEVETEQGERIFTNEQSDKDKNITTDSVQGFNVAGWTGAEKQEQEIQYGKKEKGTEKPNITRTRIRQGNIGVTKTTELIRDYREIESFDPYQFIIDSFIRRFCIEVY